LKIDFGEGIDLFLVARASNRFQLGVDDEGDVLDILAQTRRNKLAAFKVMRKPLEN